MQRTTITCTFRKALISQKSNNIDILYPVSQFKGFQCILPFCFQHQRKAVFLKGAMWFADLEKFSLNFPSSSFVIRVNLLHL